MQRSLDRIELRGVTAIGNHGVFDFERREGQPFVVDVVMHRDFSRAAESDDVEDTAHYGLVADLIKSTVTGPAVNLIEKLAVQIAHAILEGFPVEQVDVTVHKPKAPIEVPFGDVAVVVSRSRADLPDAGTSGDAV
ncbi:dihydroneopterin aldolase [Arthrobacter sp. NPDC090010]|uniref:dihydroneopterin aldolase n=1 Tax=Arthrobacter sp. NPDC090010 TaxID=3363942 RepID=UPI00382D5425